MLAILTVIVIFLYWASSKAMTAAEEQYLIDEIYVLQNLITEHPDDLRFVKQEVDAVPSALKNASYHYYVRIFDTHDNTHMITPEMLSKVPLAAFPALVTQDWQTNIKYWQAKDSDKQYMLMTAPVKLTNDKVVLSAQIALDISYQEQLIKQYRYELGLFLIIATLLLIIIGKLIAQKGLKQLYDLAQATEHITVNNLSRRIDITQCPKELVSLCNAYNKMLARLEEAFERLSQCAAELAHELRTPINNLMGETEIILSRDRAVEEYRQALASNMEEYQRLAKLIENILFLSHAENPSASIQRITLNLSEAIHKICEYFSILAHEKNIALTCKGHGFIEGDPILFQRAISNVLANAIRHTGQEGEVKLNVIRTTQHIKIVIRDNGVGISPEHLPHVFEKFYRIDSAGQKASGSGLGLAMVQSIMDLHGGRVEISSKVGKGTTVILYFPKITEM